MGNRAVVTNQDKSKAFYLHWNGGRDTIEPLCEVARRLCDSEQDKFEFLTELAKKVFDAEPLPYMECDQDNGDNGVYILDKNLHIVGREYAPLQEQDDHNYQIMLGYICACYASYELELDKRNTDLLCDLMEKFQKNI